MDDQTRRMTETEALPGDEPDDATTGAWDDAPADEGTVEERKGGAKPLHIVLAVVAAIAVIAGIWFFTAGGGGGDEDTGQAGSGVNAPQTDAGSSDAATTGGEEAATDATAEGTEGAEGPAEDAEGAVPDNGSGAVGTGVAPTGAPVEAGTADQPVYVDAGTYAKVGQYQVALDEVGLETSQFLVDMGAPAPANGHYVLLTVNVQYDGGGQAAADRDLVFGMRDASNKDWSGGCNLGPNMPIVAFDTAPAGEPFFGTACIDMPTPGADATVFIEDKASGQRIYYNR